MIIQEEDYLDCENELVQLGKYNYKEIKIFPYEYNPDLELLRLVHSVGMLFLLTLRDADNNLKGYSLNTLVNSMLSTGVKQSVCNMLYVSPDSRGRQSLKLMKRTEETAKLYGASMHIWGVSPLNDFSPILKRTGYKEVETMYYKCLGD